MILVLSRSQKGKETSGVIRKGTDNKAEKTIVLPQYKSRICTCIVDCVRGTRTRGG